MQNEHKFIIVGAGPIGLFLASEFEKADEDYIILEASDHIGGQLMNLYPEKDIIQLNTKEILLGGGNVHCITMQIPYNKEFIRKNEN